MNNDTYDRISGLLEGLVFKAHANYRPELIKYHRLMISQNGLALIELEALSEWGVSDIEELKPTEFLEHHTAMLKVVMGGSDG